MNFRGASQESAILPASHGALYGLAIPALPEPMEGEHRSYFREGAGITEIAMFIKWEFSWEEEGL